jgi:DNA polymerase III delta prime subunit
MIPDLWVDKYKPMTIDDYVFQNEEDRQRIKEWIKQGWTDNLILAGPPGTGKTSLIRVVLNEIGVDHDDFLKINAARAGTVDTIKGTITDFIQTGGWSSLYRYIVLNEADGMTAVAQPMLNDDMEEYSDTIRWMLTTNKLHKIINPVQDRCTVIKIDAPDQEQLINRMLFILEQEKIPVDDDSLAIVADIIDNNYPSVRKCVRALQNSVVNGRLQLIKQEVVDETWKHEIVDAFKSNDLQYARNMIRQNMTRDDIEGYIVWLANHLELFDNQLMALGKLREALIANPTVADPEINLSATLGLITQG